MLPVQTITVPKGEGGFLIAFGLVKGGLVNINYFDTQLAASFAKFPQITSDSVRIS